MQKKKNMQSIAPFILTFTFWIFLSQPTRIQLTSAQGVNLTVTRMTTKAC